MSRVIALGLDSADSGFIDELVAAGSLPNLARFRSGAARVRLRTASTYRAEYAWTEFTTGRRSDTSRYWSTVDFDPDTYDSYMRGACPAEPFYALPDATVVTFDYPKVVPSPMVRGLQALGWGAHSPQHPTVSTPAGLLDEITARFGAHPAIPIEYAGSWHQPDHLTRFGAAQEAGVRCRSEILRWLATREPGWDLLTTLVGETHQSGHLMWHGVHGDDLTGRAASVHAARAGMLAIHRAIDDLVGDVLAWAPDDATVIVFSTQGMTSAHDDTMATTLLPELMLRLGAGEARLPANDLRTWRRRGAAPVVPSVWDSPIGWTARRFGPNLGTARRNDRRAAARAHLRLALTDHAPALLRTRRRPPAPAAVPTTFPYRDLSLNEWHVAGWYRDAWPRLPAFVIPGFSDAHIRINLAGRERDGVVALDDYDAACDDVERSLRACRSARTGDPIVADITRMRAGDPCAPGGPGADLVVQLWGTDAIEHPDAGSIGPTVAMRTGSHTEHGFADISGPGIDPGDRGTFGVCDLSATICALLGRTALVPLDGRSFLD